MRRPFVAMAALLLGGCRSLEDPAPSQQTRLVVHGVLNQRVSDQTVLIYRARTGLPSVVEGSGVSDDEPVSDAQVSLTAPDGATYSDWRLAYPSGECCLPGMYLFPRPPDGPPMTPGCGFERRQAKRCRERLRCQDRQRSRGSPGTLSSALETHCD